MPKGFRFDRTDTVSKMLDTSRETRLIKDELTNKDSEFDVEVAEAPCTWDNLLMYAKQAHVLHITGHGVVEGLIVEDFNEGSQCIKRENFQKLKEEYLKNGTLQIVFISMCHSGNVGKWFSELGIPYVIYVETDKKVKDKHATTFARKFYRNLMENSDVVSAYNSANNVLSLDSKNPVFILKEYGARQRTKFGDLSFRFNLGNKKLYKPESIKCNITGGFREICANIHGRLNLIQRIYKECLVVPFRRMICLIGPDGIGKKSLCQCVLHRQMHLRHDASDSGVIYIDLYE
eukprot:UN25157